VSKYISKIVNICSPYLSPFILSKQLRKETPLCNSNAYTSSCESLWIHNFAPQYILTISPEKSLSLWTAALHLISRIYILVKPSLGAIDFPFDWVRSVSHLAACHFCTAFNPCLRTSSGVAFAIGTWWNKVKVYLVTLCFSMASNCPFMYSDSPRIAKNICHMRFEGVCLLVPILLHTNSVTMKMYAL